MHFDVLLVRILITDGNRYLLHCACYFQDLFTSSGSSAQTTPTTKKSKGGGGGGGEDVFIVCGVQGTAGREVPRTPF